MSRPGRSFSNPDRPQASNKAMVGSVDRGLDNYQELFERLQNPNGAIKIYSEVAAR